MNQKVKETNTDLEDSNTNNLTERSSFTGTDDKSQIKAIDQKSLEDVLGAESISAAVALNTNSANYWDSVQRAQQLRHADQLNTINLRTLSNGADHDQNMREIQTSHGKSRNSQDVRHTDIAVDRQWNVDEQAIAVVKALQAMDVNLPLILKAISDGIKK